MSNFILLFGCLFCGIFLRFSKKFPSNSALILNAFALYVSLPTLALFYLHSVHFNASLVYPASMPWLVLIVAVLLIWILSKVFGWDRKKTGTLMLMAGFGNTSFVGFPLLEALMGPSSLETGLIVDQLGSFLALATLGAVIASYYGSSEVKAGPILRKIFTLPPFVAVLLAIALRPFVFPEALDSALQRVGSTLVPIALVAAGFQLSFNRDVFLKYWKLLSWGLFYKLFLAPAMVFAVYILFTPFRGRAFEITILEAAMAPMISATVLVSESDLDLELGNLMISLGIPLSLFTVPLAKLLFEHWASH